MRVTCSCRPLCGLSHPLKWEPPESLSLLRLPPRCWQLQEFLNRLIPLVEHNLSAISCPLQQDQNYTCRHFCANQSVVRQHPSAFPTFNFEGAST